MKIKNLIKTSSFGEIELYEIWEGEEWVDSFFSLEDAEEFLRQHLKDLKNEGLCLIHRNKVLRAGRLDK